jgi:hypothetical protein
MLGQPAAFQVTDGRGEIELRVKFTTQIGPAANVCCGPGGGGLGRLARPRGRAAGPRRLCHTVTVTEAADWEIF